MTGKEKIDQWSTDLDVKPLNPDATDLLLEQNSPAAVAAMPGSTVKGKIAEKCTVNKLSTRIVVLFRLKCCNQHNQYPGNPSVYPTFRDRLHDNIHTDTHAHTHASTHAQRQTDRHTYIHTYVRTYIHTYIHTYRHTRTYKHTFNFCFQN